jgi:hypothetical protein
MTDHESGICASCRAGSCRILADDDRFYLALKGARERLCIAQTAVTQPMHRDELQTVLDLVDRLGAYYCGDRWSKFDMPPTPGESEL